MMSSNIFEGDSKMLHRDILIMLMYFKCQQLLLRDRLFNLKLL